MTEATLTSQRTTRSLPKLNWRVSPRGIRYFKLAGFVLITVWLLALAFVMTAPETYLSKWTLVLPDRNESSSLALSEIGNASFSQSSPFGNIGQNPLLTYQTFATSAIVLKDAAERLNISTSELGTPRIKLIPQTPLMEFQIKGDSPEQASAKGKAIIAALEAKLQILREDELHAREQHRKKALETYNNQLGASRRAVLNHQSSTSLVTTDQFDVLATNIESHKSLLSTERANRDQLSGYLTNLYNGVGVSTEVAQAAARLQSREDMRSLLSSYAEVLVEAADATARLGDRHPELIGLQATLKSLENELLSKVDRSLRTNKKALRDIALLSTGQETGEILRGIVKASAELSGMTQKVASLSADVTQMEGRLKRQARSAALLADLERDHSIAEAVFSSALGRISTEKFDVLSAYPLFQVFSPPTADQSPDKRPILIALVGAVGISLCVLMGFVVLWLRRPLWRRITKTN